jgi:hypothetical protein
MRNSPLEGAEGRQAQGDVAVGACHLGSHRHIPPGAEAVPTPFKGGLVSENRHFSDKDDLFRVTKILNGPGHNLWERRATAQALTEYWL